VKKLRVGLIFGGRSVEHEVSLTSARAVLEHLDPARYDVVPIGVTRKGRWLTSADAKSLLGDELLEEAGTRVALTADPEIGGLVPVENGQARVGLDVVFPLIHGTGGEDGSLQGLLELAGMAYVGSGVLGSSLGMDKIAMKAAFTVAGLPTVPYLSFTRHRIETGLEIVTGEIETGIGFPCFTKPANGGSSVGIRKIHGAGELEEGLREAARYDRRVLVEQGIDGQEVECAVLGNETPEASVIGEIIPCREFYDYSAKYLEEGSELVVPARLPARTAGLVREMALSAFKAIDAAGMARVDFFVRRTDGGIFVNEINTIPGFTPISMYPRLWEASGVGFSRLLDRLIALALERHQERTATRREWTPELPARGASTMSRRDD